MQNNILLGELIPSGGCLLCWMYWTYFPTTYQTVSLSNSSSVIPRNTFDTAMFLQNNMLFSRNQLRFISYILEGKAYQA